MATEVPMCRKEKMKRRAPRALIVEKVREGLEGKQDMAPAAVAGSGQQRWQCHSRCDARGMHRTGEQGRCQWAGTATVRFPICSSIFKLIRSKGFLTGLKNFQIKYLSVDN
jgi:hypothetical protein